MWCAHCSSLQSHASLTSGAAPSQVTGLVRTVQVLVTKMEDMQELRARIEKLERDSQEHGRQINTARERLNSLPSGAELREELGNLKTRMAALEPEAEIEADIGHDPASDYEPVKAEEEEEDDEERVDGKHTLAQHEYMLVYGYWSNPLGLAVPTRVEAKKWFEQREAAGHGAPKEQRRRARRHWCAYSGSMEGEASVAAPSVSGAGPSSSGARERQ
jgi:hypothetical protein